MKYKILINQKEAIQLGLSLQEAILLDILSTATRWAESIHLDTEKESYWVARQKIITELPILNIKPDTIYRKLKLLQQKKLIEYKEKGKKDCIRLTELGKSYSSKKSDKDSSKIGKRFKKNLEKSPTDKTIKNNTITALLSTNRGSFQSFKKKIIKKYAGKIVLYGTYVGYGSDVTFSLNSIGFIKNDFNDTVLSTTTHQDLIYEIWEFMYQHPHLVGVDMSKELL